MPIQDASYTFLSWARRGLSNSIPELKLDMRNIRLRAEVAIKLDINQQQNAVQQQIELIGPADIAGINPQVIVRTEPVNGAYNVEPNYLACIEFYDEDFPWRYTPLKEGRYKPLNENSEDKLLPWLFLLVLEENEYELIQGTASSLPGFRIKNDADLSQILPPAGETWAWAHVHLNTFQSGDTNQTFSVGVDTMDDRTTQNIDNRLRTEPNLGISRLLCPRVLSENKNYRAFLIPAFESGRLAGLNKPIDSNVKIEDISWNDKESGQEFPFYHTWSFATGEKEDFEELVRRLKPVEVNQKVGRREVNISTPGWGVLKKIEPQLVSLEGALLPPVSQNNPPSLSLLQNSSKDLSLQLSEILGKIVYNETGDPVVQPPLYGSKHAKVQELNLSLPNFWLTVVNQDARNRIAAGLGTLVVQKNQEEFVTEAWNQLGKLKEVDQFLDRHNFASIIGDNLFRKRIQNRSIEGMLQVSAQLHSKIRGTTGTLHFQIKQSKVSPAFFSAQFRKMTRPGGTISRKLRATEQNHQFRFVEAINANRMPLFSPSTASNLSNLADIHASIYNSKPTASTSTNLTNLRDVLKVPALSPTALSKASTTGFTYLNKQLGSLIPTSINTSQGSRFKTALIATATAIQQNSPAESVAIPLDPNSAQAQLNKGINPAHSYANKLKNILGTSSVPDQIMKAPEFSNPMYSYLKDISLELLIPNIKLIDYNTVTVMRSNQAFIEAYMLGLNQEFGRELLWRSYPTDLRGTYFRQFWKTMENDNYSAEQLKDITPIHTWKKTENLGQHAPAGHPDGQLVLLINGDLLKRYPNALIYLQKPEWKENKLVLAEEYDATGKLIPGVIKEPIIKSGLNDSFQLIGFDISVAKARGELSEDDLAKLPAPEANIDRAGWFIVIKEIPGEPRFGMDIRPGEMDKTWDDLDIEDFNPPFPKMLKVDRSNAPLINQLHDGRDANIAWGAHAANMAYILLQKPFQIAIPARVMIPE